MAIRELLESLQGLFQATLQARVEVFPQKRVAGGGNRPQRQDANKCDTCDTLVESSHTAEIISIVMLHMPGLLFNGVRDI